MKNEKRELKNELSPRVVIIHDWLYGGGAEKVVEQLHELYPEAPIYTSYCSDEWRKRLDNKIVTGYLQNWPFNKLRKFLPLLRQFWFARINLEGFDLIISSTGNGEAKFVRAPEGATHICYCHSPPHFYWRKYNQYLKNPGFGKLNWVARTGLKLSVKPLRNRDYLAAQKVDHFIANSRHIQADIKKFYGRESEVIHPPVDIESFIKASKTADDSETSPFIWWGRHVPDKRIDIAIAACNELELPLLIIGSGVQTQSLKNISGSTIRFYGKISDQELRRLAASAKAFIFPSEEDFGIAPIEALASGIPVIAYKSGGALDYIIEGKNGLFFDNQTTESLMNVLKSFDPASFNKAVVQKSAEKFAAKNFKSKFTKFVSSVR